MKNIAELTTNIKPNLLSKGLGFFIVLISIMFLGSALAQTVPTVPTGLTSSNITSISATITWTASTDNAGVAGYKVYRGGALIGSTITNSYTDSSLTASTFYGYTVSAYDAAGNSSAQSVGLILTTLAPSSDITPPSVPTGLASSNITQTSATITWTASTDNVGVAGYRVYRGSTLIGSTITNSYTDSSLTASTFYGYTVSAYDAAGNSSAQSVGLILTTLTATSFYVYCGATGSANGTGWTDAYTDLPASLIRGDVYVIAGSSSCNYSSHAFNDAENGTSVITIRKAETSLDSSVTGWQSSFATAQAVWNAPMQADPQDFFYSNSAPLLPLWGFCQGYYTVDGITGSTDPSNPGGQGFLVQSPAPSYHGLVNISNNNGACTLSTSSTPKVFNNIIIHHVEVSGVQNYYQVPVTACSYNSGTATITTNTPGWSQGWVVGDIVSGFNSANDTNEVTNTAILTVSSNTFTVSTSPDPCASLAVVVLEPVGAKGVGSPGVYAVGSYNSYNNLDISYNYIHTNGPDNLDLFQATNITVDHNYFTGNESNHESHGQPMQVEGVNGMTVAYNSFVDITGTAALFNSAGPNDTSYNWNFYGNLIYETGTNRYAGVASIIQDNCGDDTTSGIHGMNVYNNTIANLNNGALDVDAGLIAEGYPNTPCSTGWVVENNFWWNDIQAAVWDPDNTSSHDYNTFLNTPLAYLTVQAPHEYQTNSGSSSPFISSTNFQLSNPTGISYLTGGVSLNSPYNTDPNGTPRGPSPNWDIGAYQYSGSSTTTLGDVNGDGNVTIYDAELTAQYAIGLPVSNFNTTAAEVDGTGKVDIYDAFLIAEYAVGLITKFPVQQ